MREKQRERRQGCMERKCFLKNAETLVSDSGIEIMGAIYCIVHISNIVQLKSSDLQMRHTVNSTCSALL